MSKIKARRAQQVVPGRPGYLLPDDKIFTLSKLKSLEDDK